MITLLVLNTFRLIKWSDSVLALRLRGFEVYLTQRVIYDQTPTDDRVRDWGSS